MIHAPFVARQGELALMNQYLDRTLAGEGQVCFVTGDAGSGKSTLVREFCRQVLEQHKAPIIAFGQSDAETGVGDPNLPFREILAQLTGDLDSDIAQAAVTEENADRLRGFFGFSAKALVELGPDLIGIFLPGAGLLVKAGAFAAERAGWMNKLEQLCSPKAAAAVSTGLEQDHIFEQYTNVLRGMSAQSPIILVLDDLHWADQASTNLLFRLGRRISRNRILIVGTYRPDEVAIGRMSPGSGQMERHPLDKVLAEFKRYYGEINIDLNKSARSQGQVFVDALLDTEPNQLGVEFRGALNHHTDGNPLFTIELLRAMQERGDILKDDRDQWVEGSSLNWDKLPARVEGVVQERIGRLDVDLSEILTVASVEGDTFTAEVIARVQQLESRALILRLSRELDQQHHLISGQGVRRLDSGQRLSLYRFEHNLFQTYLYNNLDEVQRVILHEDIGFILEQLHAEEILEITFQLARHFVEAGIRDKSIHYLRQAGEQAAAQYAYEDAITYFNRALSLLVPDEQMECFELLCLREQVSGMLGDRESQRNDLALLTELVDKLDLDQPDTGVSRRAVVALRQAAYAQEVGEYQEIVQSSEKAIELAHGAQDIPNEARGYLFWGRALWRQGDWEMAGMQLQIALDLARQASLRQEEAESLRNLGIVSARTGNYTQADMQLNEALEIFREIGDRQGQTGTINAMGVFAAEQGDFDSARERFEQSLSVYREIGDRWGEGAALSNLGQVCAERGSYKDARNYLEQALEICAQIDDREGEGTILNNLGQMVSEQGDYGAARDYLSKAVQIHREIGNPRVEGFALGNLGLVYLHLGDLDSAEEHFEQGLQVLRVIDDPQGLSMVLAYRALCLHRLGQNETARDVSREALRIAEDVGDRAAQAYALMTLGHALAKMEDPAGAAEAYHKSLEIRLELDQQNMAAEAHASLANLALTAGDLEGAKSHVEFVLDYLETGNLDGAFEPLRVYLTCIRVLRTLKDARADNVLDIANFKLHQQAYQIDDPALKSSFLSSEYARAIQELQNSGE